MKAWEPPKYLDAPSAKGQHIYGKVAYDSKEKCWVVRGEPVVVEMAKRLFPGSQGRGQGVARFPATPRATGDLNWLMLRFPLRVADEARWQDLRDQAIEHVKTRVVVNQKRPSAKPPAEFNGTLKPKQEEGLAYLLNNKRTLLGDEMGTGKTPTSLAWIAATRARPALLVVQPHTIRQWEREVTKFLPDAVRHTIHGMKPYPLPDCDIYLVHYLLLARWRETLLAMKAGVVVFDEVQELRRAKTLKYSAASEIAESAPYCAGLSGTPIHNLGAEIWNVLNIIDYHCLGDFEAFTREWCHGYGDLTVVNPDLLRRHMEREGLFLRRRYREVYPDAPPKNRIVEHIDSDRGLYGTQIGPVVELAVRQVATKNWNEKGLLTRDIENKLRRATGLAKAKYVCAFVRGLVEAGEPTLLFAWHHDVWDVYQETLADLNPALVTGRESGKEKDEGVTNFLSGQTDLAMLSLRVATGLNLPRARCVVFGELDWSPGVHAQCEDRTQRGEATDHEVLCYYLVSDDGMDATMMDSLGLKTSQFVGLMGDKPETEKDRAFAQTRVEAHMKQVIERLSKGDRMTGTGPAPDSIQENHDAAPAEVALGLDRWARE